VALIAYIDTELLFQFVTYAKVPAGLTAIDLGEVPVLIVGVGKAVSTPVVELIAYMDMVLLS